MHCRHEVSELLQQYAVREHPAPMQTLRAAALLLNWRFVYACMPLLKSQFRALLDAYATNAQVLT